MFRYWEVGGYVLLAATPVERLLISVALPAEVAAGVPALESAVTCNAKVLREANPCPGHALNFLLAPSRSGCS